MTEQELYEQLKKQYDKIRIDLYKDLAKYKPLNKKRLLSRLLRANEAYWIARLSKLDEYFVQEAEKVAVMLSVPYMNAAREFSQEAKRIYTGYRSAFDLSQRDADRLLMNVRYDKPLFDILKATANKMPDGEDKTRILAEISAPAYRYRLQRADIMAQQVSETCKTIASGEVATDRAVMQTTIEKAYNITLDGLDKEPVQQILDDIKGVQKQTTTPVFTATQGIQEFTPTTEKGILDSFNQINEDAVKEIVNRNWSGHSFSKAVWQNTDEVAVEIKKALIKGELTGASVDKIAADIQRRFEVGSYEARRLVRTELNYCENQAVLKAYDDEGVEKYKYLAIIDDRTSEICTDLDGKVFYVKDAAVGINYPPMHPFCRSTTIAIRMTERELDDEIDRLLDSIGAPEGVDPLEYLGEELLKQYA